MSILLNNKILQATEEKLESTLLPDNRADYMKIVVAGMKVALNGGPNGMMRRLRESRDPLNDCAVGAVNLVMMMSRQSTGHMPTKALIPAAMTLMLQALDFVDKAGVMEIGVGEVERATHIFTNKIFAAFKITPQMLNKAAENVHGIMKDPAKMELVNRRIGAVKDPRASTPTPIPPGGRNGV